MHREYMRVGERREGQREQNSPRKQDKTTRNPILPS